MGCGMTRAIASLLRGRFRKGVRFNPRVLIVARCWDICG